MVPEYTLTLVAMDTGKSIYFNPSTDNKKIEKKTLYTPHGSSNLSRESNNEGLREIETVAAAVLQATLRRSSTGVTMCSVETIAEERTSRARNNDDLVRAARLTLNCVSSRCSRIAAMYMSVCNSPAAARRVFLSSSLSFVHRAPLVPSARV